jgi:ABC-type branched-subunit amino acid transport system substrate-binding protein
MVCACVALGAGLAGCASSTSQTITVAGKTLAIYASQPPNGAGGEQAKDVLAAEQLAFHESGGHVGTFGLKLVTVDGPELSDNARSAVADKTSIAYLGELVPGTSWVSIEITNEEDLLQVSPSDTAIFLTQPTSAVPGAPGRYYPSSKTYGQTFGRVVPNTAQEAKAQIQEMQAMHVQKLYIADDGQPYGESIALEVKQDAAAAGISVSPSGPPTAAGFTASGAGALFLGASSEGTAKTVLDGVAAASPKAKLFASSALYGDAFASSLSPAAQRNLVISSPGFLPADLPAAGVKFVSDFTTAYGHAPAPVAIFGYEAMAAVIGVLQEAGAGANSRAVVSNDFRTFSTVAQKQTSVVGPYSIVHGDTTLAPFVFGRMQGGQLVPFTFVRIQG